MGLDIKNKNPKINFYFLRYDESTVKTEHNIINSMLIKI